eukprot:CAMPEP_0195541298 /NCGR_PEP_ID=MMETSP0794_2-20130614/51016_1 /TAXON_ID=515487 /ORGANISM="Stephanopyxis turris, Strain CCMP 815" /LENGTH=344 /DNA_ID=CAMNT_0040675393 /DNA_START=84 /DNA_END=1118 /DNA_ORIENTATION=-
MNVGHADISARVSPMSSQKTPANVLHTPRARSPHTPTQAISPKPDIKSPNPNKSTSQTSNSGKRVRRKCNVQNCSNRVVQGGLCIAHGAKRKTCSYEGCNKNVKKAGLCSAHGPARKRCEVEGCGKVSVQGGRCITHGAKKKLCCVENCPKQSIIKGMCKKHYDEDSGKSASKVVRRSIKSPLNKNTTENALTKPGGIFPKNSSTTCVFIGKSPGTTLPSIGNSAQSCSVMKPSGPQLEKPRGHERGLSIFHDMNAMDAFICDENGANSTKAGTASTLGVSTNVGNAGIPSHGNDSRLAQGMNGSSTNQNAKERRRHQRGLSLFSDESFADSIIANNITSNIKL